MNKTKTNQPLTVGVIAEQLGCKVDQVIHIIRYRHYDHTHKVGIYRVFSRETFNAIKSQIENRKLKKQRA